MSLFRLGRLAQCTCQQSLRYSSSLAPATPSTTIESKYSLPNALKLQGVVTTINKMINTTTVTVSRTSVHHKTLKEFTSDKKYLVHDPESNKVVGDKVTIRHCHPVSKRKHFEMTNE